MSKLFDLKGNGTNVRTEILAGVTTFATMAYILVVQAVLSVVLLEVPEEFRIKYHLSLSHNKLDEDIAFSQGLGVNLEYFLGKIGSSHICKVCG